MSVAYIRAMDYSPQGLHSACGDSTCVVWPAPDMSCFPCSGQFTMEQYKKYLPIVNRMAFEDFGSRWPGCCCYARLRICLPCSCACSCGCRLPSVDLWETVRYPILDVVGWEVDGVWKSEEEVRAKFAVHQHRNLVPLDGALPSSRGMPGSDCSQTVVVRYGQAPHPLAVEARDQKLFEMMVERCGVSKGSCAIKKNIVSLSENGRQYSYDRDRPATLYEEARWRFQQLNEASLGMVDPAEFYGTSAPLVESVPWDEATPLPVVDGCMSTDDQVEAFYPDLVDAESPAEAPGEVDPVTGQPIP